MAERDTNPFLRVRNLTKKYGDAVILNAFNADIQRGELVTFIGPSGCGKSTLLRCIAGFSEIQGGDIILEGESIVNSPPNKRGVGMVFQNYALFPHLTVADNIGYGLKIMKMPSKEIAARVNELLDLVHLNDMGPRRIYQLSGGQQQRVALARALSTNPKVLLLDEPLSNLDANLRMTMRSEIKRIQRKLHLTVLFVTHDQEEAMSIADRIMVMSQGQIAQIGTPMEIYDKPESDFIAGFVGFVNILNGVVKRVESNSVSVETKMGMLHADLDAGMAFRPGDIVKVVVRPENINLSHDAKAPKDNLFPGEITTSMYMGSQVKYIIDVSGQKFVVCQYNPREIGSYSDGQKVHLEILRKVHIIKEQ